MSFDRQRKRSQDAEKNFIWSILQLFVLYLLYNIATTEVITTSFTKRIPGLTDWRTQRKLQYIVDNCCLKCENIKKYDALNCKVTVQYSLMLHFSTGQKSRPNDVVKHIDQAVPDANKCN